MPVFDSNQQTWEPQTDFNSSRFFSFYKQTGCVKVKGVLPKFRKFSTQLDNFQKHTFFLWTHPLNLVVHITPKKQTTGNLTIMKLWWPDMKPRPRLQVNGRYKRVSWQKVTRHSGNDGWSTYPQLTGLGLRNKRFKKAIISGRGYIWG